MSTLHGMIGVRITMYKRLVTTETNRTHIQDYTLTLNFDTHSEAVKTKY